MLTMGPGPYGRWLERPCRSVIALALILGIGTAHATEFPPADCIITPSETVDLSAPVPGTLGAVSVDRSDRVEKGQVLAELSSGVERADLEIATARARMSNEIRLWETSLEFDTLNRDRLESLYVKSAVSPQDKDQAERDAELSRLKLKRAKDLYALRQIELLRAQEVLEQKTIRSPFAGIVLRRFKSVGEYVEEQPVVRIAQLDPLHVEVIVPMELFGRIQEGALADVTTENASHAIHRATVTVVDPMGDAASGTFGVRLTLPNPDYRIPAGLKCTVQFLPPRQVANADPDTEAFEHGADGPMAADSVNLPDDTLPSPVAELAIGSDQSAIVLAGAGDDCYALGPLSDVLSADRIRGTLLSAGYDAVRREVEAVEHIGYIVLAPEQETRSQTETLVTQLRQSGVKDLLVLSNGPYAGRVSLGVFFPERAAKRRRIELEDKGFQSVLIERTRTLAQWWLDVRVPPEEVGTEALRNALRAVDAQSLVDSLRCPAGARLVT